MKLRRYTVKDIPVIMDLIDESISQTIWKDIKQDRVKVQKMLEGNERNVLFHCNLVEVEGTVVGGFCATVGGRIWTDEVFAYDQLFYIREDHRNLKTATALVDAYKEWANERKVRKAFLSNSMGMNRETFSRLVRTFGFEEIGSISYMEIR